MKQLLIAIFILSANICFSQKNYIAPNTSLQSGSVYLGVELGRNLSKGMVGIGYDYHPDSESLFIKYYQNVFKIKAFTFMGNTALRRTFDNFYFVEPSITASYNIDKTLCPMISLSVPLDKHLNSSPHSINFSLNINF